MSLEMKKTSRWWYARIQLNGKSKQFNLKVEIKGRRPKKITQPGDRLFEQSRVQAQEKHDRLKEELLSKRHAEEYVQQLHEIRTGSRIASISIPSLPEEWETAPRRKKGSERYVAESKRLLEKLADFLKTSFPEIEGLSEVTPDMAERYMRQLSGTGISGRTWNRNLILFRSAFKCLTNKAKIVKNPFEGIPTREENTIHRQPYSQGELQKIMGVLAMEDHAFIRPVFFAGICTAMRQGDCCCLKWEDVDLSGGFLNVKTSKTGEKVEIPMFPILQQEIQSCVGNGSEYVFPEQAEMYLHNRYGIGCRIRNVLKAAGFDAVRKKERKDGKNKGSVKDFHSFRVTWITLALSAGVPLEIVRRVTGHKTTDVVLKHYFRPGREEFRKTITSAMPKLLTQGTKIEPPKEQLLKLVDGMNEKTWRKRQDELRRLINELVA